MKITVNECEFCGDLFEDDKEYKNHYKEHLSIEKINEKYPKVEEINCEFSNGKFSVQRSKEFIDGYADMLKKAVVETCTGRTKKELEESSPYSYYFGRVLDDWNSVFSSYRLHCFCQKCFKEWGQPYYANKCCGNNK